MDLDQIKQRIASASTLEELDTRTRQAHEQLRAYFDQLASDLTARPTRAPTLMRAEVATAHHKRRAEIEA